MPRHHTQSITSPEPFGLPTSIHRDHPGKPEGAVLDCRFRVFDAVLMLVRVVTERGV